MRIKQNDIRKLLVKEAARLMHEEGVEQYLDAKRKAAKRIVGKDIRDLPSNGEISDELYRISKFDGGDELATTLFEMRLLALEVMERLIQFSPRLIGSVSTGRIRQGSDVDLHIFTDNLDTLQSHLDTLDWNYSLKKVWIQKDDKPVEFTHIYLELEFPVELSVYPVNEIRVRGRSSTDGKPIQRLSISKLKKLMLTEHAEV